MPTYDVQMQTAFGEIVERQYKVGWDPNKVTPEFVAVSCAAEHTVASGRISGSEYKVPHAGLTAILREDVLAYAGFDPATEEENDVR